MSEVIISTQDYVQMTTAPGYFLNGMAYYCSFPDNDEDAKALQKSATGMFLTARNLIGPKLDAKCGDAFKKHASDQPEFKAAIVAAEARLKQVS